jgi:uncharacterized protein YrrD
MLRNLKQIEGRALRARDGTLGEVKDFIFDDAHWHIRYLVVETGAWLNTRRVLISSESVNSVQDDPDVFAVDLTMDQVRHSPELSANQPVAHEQEAALRMYYGWPSYWDALAGFAVPIIATAVNTLGPGTLPVTSPPNPLGDPHLRSVNHVVGFHIHGSDGAIGHVEDCLVDQQGWRIWYLVLDTGRWLPGRKVIVAPGWIREIDWENKTLNLGMTRRSIEASPRYEAAASWNRDYIERLHDYYGLPRPADQ